MFPKRKKKTFDTSIRDAILKAKIADSTTLGNGSGSSMHSKHESVHHSPHNEKKNELPSIKEKPHSSTNLASKVDK